MGSDLLYMTQPRWHPTIQFGTSTMCSRSHNRYAERFAYEKEVWAPFPESLAKDGSRTGWSRTRAYSHRCKYSFPGRYGGHGPKLEGDLPALRRLCQLVQKVPPPTWNLAPPSSNMKSCGRSFPQTPFTWMTTSRQQNDSHGGSNPVPLGLLMPGLNWVVRT